MAALAEQAGRLEAGRATAGHGHPALGGCTLDAVRHLELATRGGVVDAEGRARGVNAVDAHVRAHARPDPVLVAGGHLGWQVRVSEQGARHPDEVEQARLDRVAGRRDVRDPCRVHDGDG